MTEGSLQIIDTRTSYEYEIPIHHNTVPASAFRAIKGSSADSQSKRKGNGLKLYDPGLTNTAIAESDMTLT
jgi:citrate synthase